MIRKWLSKNKEKKITAIKIVFIAYLSILLFLLFFSREYGKGNAYNNINVNPFASIAFYFKSLINYGSFKLWVVNIIGNILVFIPFGFLLPIIFEKYKSFIKVIIIIICFSFMIEIAQYITNIGVFDIDDIILNTLGGLVGYAIFGIMK